MPLDRPFPLVKEMEPTLAHSRVIASALCGPFPSANHAFPSLPRGMCAYRLDAAGKFAILRSLMGDKSPKATNKKAAQKQIKDGTTVQKKGEAVAAKHRLEPKK